MSEWTSEQIAQAALDRDLVTQRQLSDVWNELGTGHDVDPEQFKQCLLRRELLTNYQLEKLLKGDRGGYYYGDYKVLYLVGRGTFARVYRATHRHTGQMRAIKVLRSQFFKEKKDRDNFMREGEMGKALRHPNIVSLLEAVELPHCCYLVMEFIEGQNLREFLKRRGHFDPIEATRIAIDICRGLDYAFQRGVTHRDLKSSNVLVSSLGQAKLVDFGLAGFDEDEKSENARTIDYAALERATGVRKDDTRSDIFFLGCIYYQMLCGRTALEETRDRSVRLSRTRLESIVPITELKPYLPAEIVAVVNKAIKLDPESRHQTPSEMLGELLAIASHAPAPGRNGEDQKASAAPAKQRTLLIIEQNPQLLENLRSQFKHKGYRVLASADPQRPAGLFTDTNRPADCVLFSASSLGEESLEAFNAFAELPQTKSVPAVLLLGPKQQGWTSRAKTDDIRAIATAPIKMKELLALFDKLSGST
ncbi:MAG: serine/threonine protein kinase [Pirellulales bacterium]|nr:serine/threonine protein kinase [Pirellulales bacterium]